MENYFIKGLCIDILEHATTHTHTHTHTRLWGGGGKVESGGGEIDSGVVRTFFTTILTTILITI